MTNKFTIKILVLDDDPFMLKLLTRMLENMGCAAVTSCDSGRAALGLIDGLNDHPDIILLDLNMPEMDGLEFVRHLAEHRYTGSLILMSGEDEHLLSAAEKLVRAHRIPVLGSLRKPITREGLAALLGKCVSPYQDFIRTENIAHSADELRAAIAHDELVNYYQPKVCLATGQVVGVETLVRWRHPQDGMVFSSRFIGVAESHGLIHDLTRRVLSSAFGQAKKWREAGLTLQLAVNASIADLESLDFADMVVELVAEADIPPQDVMLEVAESWLPMHDMRATLESLVRLHLKRIGLSVDEFGTGYSSWAQLRGLPFDELKIDRYSVHHVATDRKVREKYDSSLTMAKKLGIKVAAVGVEELSDWDVLRRTGCDFAQGYFIARPMPADELPDWIQAWQVRVKQEVLAETV